MKKYTYIAIQINKLQEQDFIYTEDLLRNIAAAVLFLIENGKIGEKYNISVRKK